MRKGKVRDTYTVAYMVENYKMLTNFSQEVKDPPHIATMSHTVWENETVGHIVSHTCYHLQQTGSTPLVIHIFF